MLREADLQAVCESSHLCLLAGGRPEWREASPSEAQGKH